jgi:hypothetical protein
VDEAERSTAGRRRCAAISRHNNAFMVVAFASWSNKMALNLVRSLNPNFVGDGTQTIVSFDLRDCTVNSGANPLVNPPFAVISNTVGVAVVSQQHYNVTLSFTTAPTSAGQTVALTLLY